MKLFLLGLTACIAFVTVRGMETCPPEFEETADRLQVEHPDWIACNTLVEEQGDDPSVYCFAQECQRGAQTIYDIFPENCEVPDWIDYGVDGNEVRMTKEHYASLALKHCNWDLKNTELA